MERLLEKLYKLKLNEEIKSLCGDRVFMNNTNQSVQMPYISYNPFVSSKPLVNTMKPGAECTIMKHSIQINAYMTSTKQLTILHKAITKVMAEQGFKQVLYHVEAKDDVTWLILRYKIKL